MTKDWDAVQEEIKELSFNQKKSLEEVKTLMERKHKFRASTRAYRMKLKEWGFMRHKRHRLNLRRNNEECNDYRNDDDSSTEAENIPTKIEAIPKPKEIGRWQVVPESEVEHAEPTIMGLLHQSPSFNLTPDPLAQARTEPTEIVMDMLDAILQNDSSMLEKLLVANISHVNDPIGLPFDTPNSRFFNHLIMREMVILQHPDQTLLDIACGMPCGPIVWILLAHGAKGSRHPLGTDLALHNAIKNGRPYTVQAMLMPGRSQVNGVPGTSWKPLLQAVFWNHPEVVRIIRTKVADIDDAGPSPNGPGLYTALQLCLLRRMAEYTNLTTREKSNQILKMLLEAGASIHVVPPDGSSLSPFEMFLQPIQNAAYWDMHMSPLELDCLALFVSKGADPQSPFNACLCGSPSRQTFAHQVLWHAAPSVARRIVDSVSAMPDSTGLSLLHELLGSCPDATRHPSDTLRDIEVLIRAGVDVNLCDINGITPLTRCIEQCPAVDLVARLKKLCEGSADPEQEGPDGVQPYVLAARTFQGSLLAEVMEILVSKIQGQYKRVVGDVSFAWDSTHFPITEQQTYEQVMSCSRSTGDFRLKLREMVPEDIHVSFNRAYFSVVSTNYLNTMARAAKQRAFVSREKYEIVWVLGMRNVVDSPMYKLDQELVIALLDPLSMTTMFLDPAGHATLAAPSTDTYSITTHEPFHFNPNGSTETLAPIDRISSSHEDYFVPETAKIRWKDPCAESKPGDLAKAVEAIVQYKCPSCDDGNLLTKSELEKHKHEHEHTAICDDDDECRRRFCLRKRNGEILDEMLTIHIRSTSV